jgi:hydrogenase maturation protein HypF
MKPRSELTRIRLRIGGTVQGVGFRPFVYRLAHELNLTGWVNNSSQGITIEAEGNHSSVESLQKQIRATPPPLSQILTFNAEYLAPCGYHEFEIRASESVGEISVLALPDAATCHECLADIFAANNRRYHYPFTTCNHCGPRFSILTAIPYDRENTSMQEFSMCERCLAEYRNPHDRRFHSQTNSCPDCGPQLELWDQKGACLATGASALEKLAQCLQQGSIAAVKGLGGYHLMCLAGNHQAILRLRQLKLREEKPFALMFASLDAVREQCEVSDPEAELLISPEAPIMLLQRRPAGRDTNCSPSHIDSAVAPNNPYLGIMLPYTPLHHLLMRLIKRPIVATSGNLSNEPICIGNQEALQRLGQIADLFLVHNRRIIRHVDDSIARVIKSREMILRRSRGYAPFPLMAPRKLPPITAVGAQQKNTVCLAFDKHIFISQHIGDLETTAAFDTFKRILGHFAGLYGVEPELTAMDCHPDYLASQHAANLATRTIRVQHHYAHTLACMADNNYFGPALGIAWDGSGYGLDHTIWGGEFLTIDANSFQRSAFFRPFPLLGGEKAVKEPRRSALGLLYELFNSSMLEHRNLIPIRSFTDTELANFLTMFKRSLNTPRTSSVGRLFDAIAALVDLQQISQYEGQAAMELEFASLVSNTTQYYSFEIKASPGMASKANPPGLENIPAMTTPGLVIDWAPMLMEIIADITAKVSVADISRKFHFTLAEIIVSVTQQIGEKHVILSGGCFQNKTLLERAIDRLLEEKFNPMWHYRVPPNDGGIALGQIIAASRAL